MQQMLFESNDQKSKKKQISAGYTQSTHTHTNKHTQTHNHTHTHTQHTHIKTQQTHPEGGKFRKSLFWKQFFWIQFTLETVFLLNSTDLMSVLILSCFICVLVSFNWNAVRKLPAIFFVLLFDAQLPFFDLLHQASEHYLRDILFLTVSSRPYKELCD